jgi:hypothetical protein
VDGGGVEADCDAVPGLRGTAVMMSLALDEEWSVRADASSYSTTTGLQSQFHHHQLARCRDFVGDSLHF